MKNNLLTTALFMLAVMGLSAQAPHLINYQAVARNNAGNMITNQTITVRLTIYSGSPNGAISHLETDTVITNQFGLFTIVIGKKSPIPGGFAGIAWSSGDKYLKVEIDPAAGTNFSDMGTSQLLSVPYALHAETSADNSWLKDGNNSYNANTGNVGIGTFAPTAKLDVAGHVKITDGTEGTGKVLTSDANGQAGWADPMDNGAGAMYCIALSGTFPSQGTGCNVNGAGIYLGEIRIFPYSFVPCGWQKCDGTLLSIAANNALFTLLGTTYGGDGQNTFAVPDYRNKFLKGNQ